MNSKLENVVTPKLTQPETKVDKNAKNFAASWYIAMHSNALGKQPKAIELFGQPLVAWRNQNGHPVIMERYCSHMGASLAIGKVVEGCIQCPFHHWRFDSSGECVAIPDVERIPPRARQATYVTAERYGYIWIWYGSQTPLFSLPEFPAAEDQKHNYMLLRFTNNTKTTARRVIENPYDHYHITALHQIKVSGPLKLTLLNDQYLIQQNDLPIQKDAWFGVSIEFPINKYIGKLGPLVQALGIDAKSFMMRVDGWPSGHIATGFVDGEERFKIMDCIIPVAENETISEVFVTVKKTGKFWLDIVYYLVFGLRSKSGATQDVPVFNTIKPDGGGAYVKYDLGVLKFREFYQSWVDKVEK
ncbi:hypothetical protein BZZ01_00210 [Nostocales cyanobacterium HT-58-2]|nr:hypothetical protein BZZ01_00210 [Nostocales cyanobacterium HT-58-2]